MVRRTDWFDDFTGRHEERFPRSDWPSPRSAFYDGFEKLLCDHDVTEAEADAASLALMADPPPFLDRHPAALLTRIRAARAAKAEAQRQEAAERARSASSPEHDRESQRAEIAWALATDEQRAAALALVDQRAPLLARRAAWREALAKHWHHRPAMIPPESPRQPEGASKHLGNPFRPKSKN